MATEGTSMLRFSYIVLFTTEKERVYRAVRAASSYKFVLILVFKGQTVVMFVQQNNFLNLHYC